MALCVTVSTVLLSLSKKLAWPAETENARPSTTATPTTRRISGSTMFCAQRQSCQNNFSVWSCASLDQRAESLSCSFSQKRRHLLSLQSAYGSDRVYHVTRSTPSTYRWPWRILVQIRGPTSWRFHVPIALRSWRVDRCERQEWLWPPDKIKQFSRGYARFRCWQWITQRWGLFYP